MRTTHLTENACWRIGLIPRGPVEPRVYGLGTPERSQGGYRFPIVEPWRWALVVEYWTHWAEARAA